MNTTASRITDFNSVEHAVRVAKPEWSDEQVVAGRIGVMASAELTDSNIDRAITQQVEHDDCAELLEEILAAAMRIRGLSAEYTLFWQFADSVLDANVEEMQEIALEYAYRRELAEIETAREEF